MSHPFFTRIEVHSSAEQTWDAKILKREGGGGGGGGGGHGLVPRPLCTTIDSNVCAALTYRQKDP